MSVSSHQIQLLLPPLFGVIAIALAKIHPYLLGAVTPAAIVQFLMGAVTPAVIVQFLKQKTSSFTILPVQRT